MQERKPRKAIPGTAKNFKGELHKLVPELANITDAEWEELIEGDDLSD